MKENTHNKRELKVYRKHVKPYKINSINPEIRLTGKWLRKWGFNYGSNLNVLMVDKGIILIQEGVKVPPIIKL